MREKEAVRKLEAMIKSAIDGIITMDTKGIVESVNPAAARLFGYAPEEIIGNNIRMLMPSPHHENHDGYLKNYLTTGVKKIIGIGREVQGKKKDGSLFPFRLSVSQVDLDHKKIFTGIIHDVTEERKAKEEIVRLNKVLEQRVVDRTEELNEVVNKLLSTNNKLINKNKELESTRRALEKSERETRKALEKEKELSDLKSRFVSMASHEFRTPLSTILSSAALISRYTETEQQKKRDKHIERIKSAVNNLTGILNDFLSLSKLEEGKFENQPVHLLLDDICREVLGEMEGLLKKDQQIIHEQLTGELSVFLDKRFFKNILFNLLSNAIKYSKEGQPIFCKIEKIENSLLIEIRDEGIGIPLEDQEYLFTRFFRAKNVTNIQGTGLGLNIVKRYVDLMRGTVTFQSQLNSGTTFTVKLPVE